MVLEVGHDVRWSLLAALQLLDCVCDGLDQAAQAACFEGALEKDDLLKTVRFLLEGRVWGVAYIVVSHFVWVCGWHGHGGCGQEAGDDAELHFDWLGTMGFVGMCFVSNEMLFGFWENGIGVFAGKTELRGKKCFEW